MARVLRNASLLLAAAITATATYTCTKLDPSGTPPSARTFSKGVVHVDANNNRLLIHAGEADASLQDLWAYDLAGNTWADITPSGTKPPARAQHVAVVDTSNSRLLIHGGTGSDLYDTLWAYDLAANTWADITPSSETKPSARHSHVAAVDTSNGKLLIHGGKAAGIFWTGFDDLWAYDLATNTWAQITPTSSTKPSKRSNHAAAVDTSTGRLLIHGGMTGQTTKSDELWAYDLAGNTWAEITPSSGVPPATSHHVAAVDTSNGRLLIHGGETADSTSDALWAYDLASNSWTDMTPTSGAKPTLYGHAAAFAGRLIIFGGNSGGNDGTSTNDLWEIAWVTSTSTSTSTATNTTTTTSDTATATSTTVTATETAETDILLSAAAPAICRPSAPAMFYALFCVASLAIM